MSRALQIILIFVFLAGCWCIVMPGRHSLPGETRRIAAAKIDTVAFTTALTMFQIDCDRYPTTGEGLGALINRPTAIPEGGKWRPYFAVDKLPKDPWGRPYVYECPGKHNPDRFDVYSLGPSGKGGNEAIGNWTPAQSE